MTHIRILAPFILILAFYGCSNDENPVQPEPSAVDPVYTHALTIQESLNNLLISLLAEMDTLSALDSVKQVFLRDTSVSAAYTDIQGINVQYRNGMRGGIFIDGDDEDFESVNNDSFVDDRNRRVNKDLLVIPDSKKVIFINPHYYERSTLLATISFFDRYSNAFSIVDYSIVNKLSDEADLDVFTNLSSYGYVHIYSHGNPWPRQDSLKEVYMLTGESSSPATTGKYWDDIKNGSLMIAYVSKVNSNKYFINPDFFIKYNNFQESGSLIYGGFCHSFNGTWPVKLINNAKASVYIGFDWSVPTKFNIDLSADLAAVLCSWVLKPITVGEFMMFDSIEKRKWMPDENRWVTLMYNGASDFALWGDLYIKSLIPERGSIGTAVDITGKGFGSSQGSGKVTFNGTEAGINSWSDSLIKTTVPSGASTGEVIVSANGKTSNGRLFTIGGPVITGVNPDSAYAGDLISITGSGFGYNLSAVKVYFNSIPASEIIQTGNSYINVKVPEGALSGNLHVEINNISSNNYFFKVLSETPFISVIIPSSALPGNSFRIYGTWKPANNKPPETYLRIDGIDYPIDYYVNWNSSDYLLLKLPEQINTGMKRAALIYNGKVSNEADIYAGIPLDMINTNSELLDLNLLIWVEVLKSDDTIVRDQVAIFLENLTVQWDGRTFTSSYIKPDDYSFNLTGEISDDGMTIVDLTITQKSLKNALDVAIDLKEAASISLATTYYSTYTEMFINGSGFTGPYYSMPKEDIINKFNISGKLVRTNGEVVTIRNIVDAEDPIYNIHLIFK